MENNYGMDRVIEPKYVLPTCAWKLDNSRQIDDNEIRISIRRIQLETTSFKQICLEANNNDEKIKEKIMDIVSKRGKLHNPVTDTGGLLFGVVEEIGRDYHNIKNLKVGEEVICNASLATMPLHIEKILKVDKAYFQLEAEGYTIAFDKIPLVRRKTEVPIDVLLFTFNESGTLYSVSKAASVKGNKKFLIVGNNLLTNILYGQTVRLIAGKDAEIISFFDKNTDMVVKGKTVDNLLSLTFDEIYYVDILKPMECIEKLQVDSIFDVSINCAYITGAETINLLATKSGGSVFFANLINNYNIALYITEAVSKQLSIKSAEGYLEEYDEFDIELVKAVAPYLKDAETLEAKVSEQDPFSLSMDSRLTENVWHRETLVENFICESRATAALLDEMLSVSKYDCNVLITGDTGVGKEKVANIVQKNSSRKMQPFIKINCASISPNLIESELFGYEKGAFTGANTSGKKGYFELADKGTIFLDEVGELPLDMQAKLLRVIQEGEFFRIGGSVPVKTNVRILSATNRKLEDFIEKKLFRRDLYYRLNVFPIRVPSLEERNGDIPALTKHFIKIYNEKFSMSRGINDDAVEHLCKCRWPGNIRELENVVQRLLISAKGENITLLDVMKELHEDIFESVKTEPVWENIDKDLALTLNEMVESYEKEIILHACEKYGSSRKTAKAIGISQTQLIRKKKKYNLD